MKIKIFKLSLPVLILFAVAPVFSQERIIDKAGLLTAQEKANLMTLITSAAANYNFDLVIVTEKNIGSSAPREYADNFFDKNRYGLGQNRDGALFLLVTDSRDYWFSTSGRGVNILTSAASNRLESGVLKNLRENDFNGAFQSFLLDWENFLALNANGRSYNLFYQYNILLVSIAWIIAFAIGLIVVQIWKMGMNTALPQTQAAAYVVPGSLAFKEKRDSFLYSTVSKVKRETQTSSSGKGVHVGSSGSRHGGGGGKY